MVAVRGEEVEVVAVARAEMEQTDAVVLVGGKGEGKER